MAGGGDDDCIEVCDIMVGFAHLKRQSSYVSFSNDIILVNIFGRYTIYMKYIVYLCSKY